MKSAHRPAQRRADRAGVRRSALGPDPAAAAVARPALARFITHPALWSALAALALYLPTLGFEFAWDDFELIVRNPLLARAADLPRLLLSDFWAGTGLHSGFWRPLISLSYWIDTRLFTGEPAGFHALNVIAHAGASALTALILSQAGVVPLAALLGGVWFALLPLHVEPVASISGRTDVYAAAFMLLAFWLDRRARRSGRTWCGWGTLGALTLALLSKESAVAFVPLVAIAEWARGPRGRAGSRAVARWLLPALAVCGVYLVAHALLVPPANAVAGIDPLQAARVRAAAWLEFPGHLLFLWPWVSHAPGPVLGLPAGFWNAPVLGACLLQLGVVAGVIALVARRSALAVPAALVWLPMLPLTVVALTGGQLLFAERFGYLSSVGVAWLIAIAVNAALGAGRDRAAAPVATRSESPGPLAWAVVVAVGALSLAGGLCSAAALPMWKNDRTVFGSMVRARPQNPTGQAGWAHLLLNDGRLDESLAHARAALALNPRTGLAYLVKSWVAIYRSEWDGALALADSARAVGSTVFEVSLVRGTALGRTGRHAEAATELEPLARRMPDDAGIQAEWGRCLLNLGRGTEALPALERARTDPAISLNPEFHDALGLALAHARQGREARAEFVRAVDLEPAYEDAWLHLARACAELGDAAGRDAALARAADLPDADPSRIASLRRELNSPRPPAAQGAR